MKTTRTRKPSGTWTVDLRTNGGNRSGIGKEVVFDPQEADFIFVLTGDGDEYLIPSEAIETRIGLYLSGNLARFRIGEVA